MTSPAPVVLLVERDILVRHPLAEYLRECGFSVFEAVDGEEARQALANPGLPFDVVLADMETPGSGFALQQWIRDNNHSAEIILVGSVEKAVERSADICREGPALAKPFQHHLVLDHIRRAIARRNRGQSS